MRYSESSESTGRLSLAFALAVLSSAAFAGTITGGLAFPGETIPAHTHEDEDQIYWVQSGEGFVELAGKRTEVSAGSAVMIPLGTEHLLTNTGTKQLDYVFFVVFVPERP